MNLEQALNDYLRIRRSLGFRRVLASVRCYVIDFRRWPEFWRGTGLWGF